MKTCNDNHLQMANQKSNIDRGGDKKGLFKTFNSKRLKKSCSLFLSSIVTLSILSVANSSFAFPAKVSSRQGLKYYSYPRTQDKLLLNGESIQNYINTFVPYSRVDVLYCRSDGWCYLSGYYWQAQNNRYFKNPVWAKSTGLCDGLLGSPLADCNSQRLQMINISNQNYSQFFCGQVKNPKWNPWRELFVDINNRCR